MRVAVTGANGFVGARLVARLEADGTGVRAVVRHTALLPWGTGDVAQVASLADTGGWREAFRDVDTVVHLAARTHVLGGCCGDLPAYRAVNLEGTRHVATAAAEAGVRRLVFVSSIKVNGELTRGRPFRADDPPAPTDAYGITKWEAEQSVAEISARHGMELVVVRPPLVYGPGVKGNFARLCAALERGVVLPLAAVKNRRSLVAIDNLIDLLVVCVGHEGAPGETFLVSDGEDLTTPDLLRRLARAMGRSARLLSVPPVLLRWGGGLAGKAAEVRQLIESLQVDIDATRRTLGWTPPLTVDEGLRRAVARD